MPRSFLTELQTSFEEALARELPEEISNGVTEEAIRQVIETSCGKIVESILNDLKQQAPAMLRSERRKQAGFENRTFERWQPAFDLYELILGIVAQVGAEHDATLRPAAAAADNWTFESISHLHARGLLVAREIYALLRGGFPDGALARWRTLHELTVTAMFLHRQDSQIAFRYLASSRFQALRAARQFNDFATRARMQPFSEDELQRMEAECNDLAEQLGGRLKRDYDWAAPALNRALVTFDQIEREVGMDHWRPRYRWACQHNHGGHRPLENLLGLSEAVDQFLLVGASNSGFVDPLHMSAISLTQLFSIFLLHAEKLDRIVMIDLVQSLVDELGETALSVEQETLKAARARKGSETDE